MGKGDCQKSQRPAYRYVCNKRLQKEINWRICIVGFFCRCDADAVIFIESIRQELIAKGFRIKPEREILEMGVMIQPENGPHFFRPKRQIELKKEKTKGGVA